MEPVPSFGITGLRRSKGNSKFLLFRGILFDSAEGLQGTPRNNITVIILYSTV